MTPPDLQALVAAHSGYNNITPGAREEFDRKTRTWRERRPPMRSQEAHQRASCMQVFAGSRAVNGIGRLTAQPVAPCAKASESLMDTQTGRLAPQSHQ
jgi:hypothetical protein